MSITAKRTKRRLFSINARRLVRTLGEICARKGVRCLHIGTDYVFDGEKRTPYTETLTQRALAIRRLWRFEARRRPERCWRRSGGHLAVRVSWVFGPDRPSFIDQVLQRARQEEQAAAIADKWAVPTYTLDAAALLHPFLRDVPEGGILHLCNGGGCTWQEYGQFCPRLRGERRGGNESAHGRSAENGRSQGLCGEKRPPYTVMSSAKLSSLTGVVPRPWQEAVEKLHSRPYLRPVSSGARGRPERAENRPKGP